jgi:hypothetical protein
MSLGRRLLPLPVLLNCIARCLQSPCLGFALRDLLRGACLLTARTAMRNKPAVTGVLQNLVGDERLTVCKEILSSEAAGISGGV